MLRKLLVALVAAAPPTALSQPAQELAPILVTSTRLDPDVDALPAHVTVLTSGEIQESPAQTLPDLLRREAGINVRSLFGNYAARATVDMRGFGATGTQNTLILLDGRRLNDIDNATVDFAAIPLGNVARVEIDRGGGSVLYGDGAVGGTINIITRQATRDGTHGDVTLSGGSYESRQADAILQHVSGPASLSLSATHIDADGYRDNNELEQTDAQADLRWTGAGSEYFLKLGIDDQELGLPGGRTVDPAADIDELANDRRGTSTPDDFANQDGYLATIGTSRFIGDDAELVIDGGVRYKNQEAFLNFGGGFTSFIDTDLATWSLTPRVDAGYQLFGLDGEVTFGTDFYYSNYDSDRPLVEGAAPIHRLDVRQSNLAVYGLSTIDLTRALALTAGLRLQRVDLSARDDFDPTAPGGASGSQAADLDRDDTEPAYELGLTYSVTDRVSVFGRATRSLRFTTVDELFEFDPSFTQVFSPLEPQIGDTFDLGLGYRKRFIDLSSSVYYGEFENEIAFDPTTFTNFNLDPTRRYGLELSAEGRVLENVRLAASYTYTRAEFDGGENDGNEVPLVPEFQGSVGLFWDILPAVTAGVSAFHVGSKRFENDQSNTFARIPAYTMVDLEISGRLSGWNLSAAVNNLSDEEAFDLGVNSTTNPGRFSAFPLPERNFLVSLGRSF